MEFKELLENIIKKFAQESRVFANERQFQLSLAFELEKLYPNSVSLEVLSTNNNELCDSKIEKKYTDIVVSLGNNEYIAIELKYKMIQKVLEYTFGNQSCFTFSQGAYNIGSIDFLKDVERLEKLTFGTIHLNNNPNKKVVKSYAIIITNDKSYYSNKDNNSLYSEFFLTEGRIIQNELRLKTLCNRITGEKIKQINNKTKSDPNNMCKRLIDDKLYSKFGIKRKYYVDLIGSNQYVCNWQNYPVNYDEVFEYKNGVKKQISKNNVKFKYLIFEIKP